ncbi:uncharacterized protein LOC129569173 [Sitodiplosis mosellana]|uniref:uncharacterized protein LOC129569173 n=1 Tax=Sitodiplosis mosellana TaxID=263140 RepID=UPI00244513A8|nr:uncharacterized protein LOC129569173 [Sitodiplosis mosellana]
MQQILHSYQRKPRRNPITAIPPIKAPTELLSITKGMNAIDTKQSTATAASPSLIVPEASKIIGDPKPAGLSKTSEPFVAPADKKLPELSKFAQERVVTETTTAAVPSKKIEEPKPASFIEANRRTYAEELSKTPEDTKTTATLGQDSSDIVSKAAPKAIPAIAAAH